VRILNHEGRIRPIFLVPAAAIFFGIGYYFMENERYIVMLVLWGLGAACLLACMKDPRDRAHLRGKYPRSRSAAGFFLGGAWMGHSGDGVDGGDGGGGGGGE